MEQTTAPLPPEAAPPEAAPSVPPGPWSDPRPDRPVPFWASVRLDVRHHLSPEARERSFVSWTLLAMRIILASPGFKVTFVYRLNHSLVSYGGFAGRLLAGIFNKIVFFLYHCSIAPRARLHGALILPHPQGIIIGGGVVVGPRAWIFQNVTIGGSGGKPGEPQIGADARIHANAVVCGPYTIGDDVEICPNSLVQRNVPSGSMVVGVPANAFPRLAKPKAAKP